MLKEATRLKNLSSYFPNLNGLRFVAALVVIIHHAEQMKGLFGQANYFQVPLVHIVGRLGVIFFFVLSGFLITYLLLQEKRNTGTISIKSFYIRRLLRIWPLYYCTVLMGLFIMPHIRLFSVPIWSATVATDFHMKCLLFLAFVPNLAVAMFPTVPYVSQSWSVGVEEQFYLIWPILTRKINNIFYMLGGIIAIYLGVQYYLTFSTGGGQGSPVREQILLIWNAFNIDCMAIGGMAAAGYFYKISGILAILFNRWFQVAVYTATFGMLVKGIHFNVFHHEIYAVLFAIIIVNCAGNRDSVISLENRIFVYLGRISYGLYMYQFIGIVASLRMLNWLAIYNPIITYMVCLMTTVLLSAMSYHLFESRFIKAKIRFSCIITGDNVPRQTSGN